MEASIHFFWNRGMTAIYRSIMDWVVVRWLALSTVVHREGARIERKSWRLL
jgi:hypothetical protein